MLAVSSYSPDYIKTCHASIGAQLAAFAALPAGRPKEAFAPGYFSALVLVLDSFFLHRQRSNEGNRAGRSTSFGCSAMASRRMAA